MCTTSARHSALPWNWFVREPNLVKPCINNSFALLQVKIDRGCGRMRRETSDPGTTRTSVYRRSCKQCTCDSFSIARRERPSYRLCWYGQSVHYLKTLCRQKKVTLSILCQQILNRSRICLPLSLFMRLDFRKNIILTRRALGADVTSTTSSRSLQTEFHFVDSLCLQHFRCCRIWCWVRSENLVIYKNLRKLKHQGLQDNLWFSNP